MKILQGYSKGPPVALGDQKNMMMLLDAPGERLTRSRAKTGVVVVPDNVQTPKRIRNSSLIGRPMYVDTIMSPVKTEFRQPRSKIVASVFELSQPVDRSLWNRRYPDPHDPARLDMVLTAVNSNLTYCFFYEMFLDGMLSRWGDDHYNVLRFLNLEDVMELMQVFPDLLPFMTYQFVFDLPFLWSSELQKNRLEILVNAVVLNPHLIPTPYRFLHLLYCSRCENPMCIVKEPVWDEKNETTVLVERRTPLTSRHFMMASKFLLLLCPKCLEKQVTKTSPLETFRRSSVGTVQLYQINEKVKGQMLENRYSLKKPWVDIWGHSVGGKFIILSSMQLHVPL